MLPRTPSSPAAALLLYLRDSAQHRAQVLAHPRLRASRTSWFVFAFLPASRCRYPTLAELFEAWDSGLLHAKCPVCGATMLVARCVQTFGGGHWAGFCSACDAVREHEVSGDLRLVTESGVVEPTGLVTCVSPSDGFVDSRADWAWDTSADDIGIDVVYSLLSRWSVLVSIEAHDGRRWYYDPVERELLDTADHVLVAFDRVTARTPDGRALSRREGAMLYVFEDDQPRPWLERIRLEGERVHIKAGVAYLPARFQERGGALLRWKGQPCLDVEYPVPFDVLLLLADGRVPPADASAPTVSR